MANMMQTTLIVLINPFFGMLMDYSLNAALVTIGFAGLAIGVISKFHVQEKFLIK